MSYGIGRRIKAIAVFLAIAILLLAAFTCMQSGKADARASLKTYVTMDPNGWEMSGYNIPGTAANVTVATLGWNSTRLMGNVGLGDGSVSALKRMSNPEVNFSEHLFMTADVSNAPWDPSRISALSVEPGNKPESITKTANDNSEKSAEYEHKSEETPASGSASIPLNDIYHSILFGRPVDDLLYENPLTISGTIYCRLLGLGMPGGNCVSIGMRAPSYGY